MHLVRQKMMAWVFRFLPPNAWLSPNCFGAQRMDNFSVFAFHINKIKIKKWNQLKYICFKEEKQMGTARFRAAGLKESCLCSLTFPQFGFQAVGVLWVAGWPPEALCVWPNSLVTPTKGVFFIPELQQESWDGLASTYPQTSSYTLWHVDLWPAWVKCWALQLGIRVSFERKRPVLSLERKGQPAFSPPTILRKWPGILACLWSGECR